MAAGSSLSRNRKIEPVINQISKRNTKSKRTKMLIKKSMELSILCNLDINISIYDCQTNKLQQINTKDGFTVEALNKLITEGKNGNLNINNNRKFKMSIINCKDQNYCSDDEKEHSDDIGQPKVTNQEMNTRMETD